MKMSKATQVSIVVAGCAILGAGLDSGISFIQTTPDFAWEGFARAVGVGLLGGLMFWLRSPKDKRDGDEERRKGSPTDGL